MATLKFGDAANGVIGYLHKKSSNEERVYYDLQCKIYANETFLIGRNQDACRLHTNDPTVSRYHLQIHTVVYDEDEKTDIKPMVYATNLSSSGTLWNGSYYGKHHNAFLLSERDELVIGSSVVLVFSSEKYLDSVRKPETVDYIYERQQREIESFKDRYSITSRKLGSGAHASVFMAVKLAVGQQLACKIVNTTSIQRKTLERLDQPGELVQSWGATKRGLSFKSIEVVGDPKARKTVEEIATKILREVNILRKVSHPNIVRLDKVFRSTNTLYIFEELVAGGDLFSYITARGGHLDEAAGGFIIMQILEGIKYLHSNGVVHRDIKPENVLLASCAEAPRVVLSDFGSAVDFNTLADPKITRMFSLAGTYEYAAPEVLRRNIATTVGGYTKAVDMWSVGCVTTVVLTGSRPFSWTTKTDKQQNSQQAMEEASREGKLDGLGEVQEWRQLSRFPKDFVRGLLVPDPKKRFTAGQALAHPWFTRNIWGNEFKALYSKAISGWQKNTLPADVIENITPANIAGYKPRLEEPSPLKLKKHNPVEAHYQPCHKNVDKKLSPQPAQTLTPPALAIRPKRKLSPDNEGPSSKSIRTTY